MAVLKPSINAFSLLESNDPGDTHNGDVGGPAKVDAPVNINKKQQPQMSVWKANKIKAEANAAKNRQQQKQPAASKGKANSSAANKAAGSGKNRKPPQQPAASSKVRPPSSAAAANAGKYKRPQQPAAFRASPSQSQAKTAAAASEHQFEQRSPAPVSLTQILFGNAYPTARGLIYKNRKQKDAANAKDGGASGAGASTDDKKGVHTNGATVKDDAPAPVEEEPPAPVKPVLPPPPPPSLDDSAQFPSLK